MPTLASMADVPLAYFLAPVGGILALLMAKSFQGSVMKRSEGSQDMIEIAQAVRDGAMAYLTRQYKVVAGVFVFLIIFLGGMFALGLQSPFALLGVPVAGLFSGLCGWFGMKMATNASARTTHAVKDSLNEGLTVAFRSGAVMGLNVVGFALIDVSAWFFIFNATGIGGGITEITTIMLTFGMGASTQALFARVGGGIYTKAADVGADLVGKVEAGIPEDDARNPATIADNVGDNVGDVAGMGADLYESYYGSILATMALGAAAAMTLANGDAAGILGLKLATAPMALAGLGIFCSIAGIFAVKAKENATFSQLLKGLHKGVYIASALIVLGAFALLWFIFNDAAELEGVTTWWGLGLSICSGLLSGLVIAHATEYYTSYEHPPTKRIAEQALTGPATVIIAGIAEGMKSTWASLLTVVAAIILAFSFAGGGDSFLMGLYGVGIAAVGMLSTLGITLATDAYGPIADNAGGNAEMTGQEPIVRERTDMLDSLGNTTAATGKGFAIGSAALTAMALFAAYIQIVQVQIGTQAKNFYGDGSAFVEPAGSEIGFAVHQGYGKYAVITPGAEDDVVDGGMLLDVVYADGKHKSKIKDVKKGDVFALTASHDSRYEIAGDGWQATLASTQRGQIKDVLAFYDVTLANPKLLGGVFIGAMLAFLFCALTMNAVGRAAYAMMGECRRQFGFIRQALRNDGMSEEDLANPDNWPMRGVDLDGHHYPDYAQCVSISTSSAQKEMVVPSILAIAVPILVGLTLSVPGVMGMLVGGLTSGFALAVFMANAGGAWDNAKKLLESYGATTAQEMVDGTGNSTKIPDTVRDAIMDRAKEAVAGSHADLIVYGKGSDDHKATVVGDTVGDPFKDTSGPALNILIKLISIVSVVFAGLIVAYGDILGGILGI